MINMPTPVLFTPDERLKLPTDLREVSAAVALASIVDVGNHLVESFDSMTVTEQTAALAMSEAWPEPEPYEDDLPGAIREYLPPEWDEPPTGRELISRRTAVCRDRLAYLREWQRFRQQGELEAELQRLADAGLIDISDRNEAIKRLESGETLASFVIECEAMRSMDRFIAKEQRRVSSM